ncbi:MAG: hypothetical protein R3E08_02420 [Thiotrichaceae bacterium]
MFSVSAATTVPTTVPLPALLETDGNVVVVILGAVFTPVPLTSNLYGLAAELFAILTVAVFGSLWQWA